MKTILPQKNAKNTKEESPLRSLRSFAAKEFFLPYQVRWIKDPSRKRLMEKSRQIGLSLSTAFDLVKKTAANENRHDAWVSSRDDLQAQLFGADCAFWARHLHSGVSDLSLQVIDPQEKISAHVLPFNNGRAIYSLSSNPNAQAGKRGRRVFDEFALNPENRLLYAIGQPGTLWGGGMDIISTHRGTANFFNELILEIKHKANPKGFSLHTVTILDACRDGLLGKLKAKWAEADPGDDRLKWTDDDFLQSLRNECVDEETWQQEFLCQPGADEAAFLSYDLIASCEYRPGEEWGTSAHSADATCSVAPMAQSHLAAPRELYAGVDIGRVHDLTVIWVGERLGDVRYTRQVICLQNATFEAQEKALYEILALPNMRRCCIDQTGIGRQFAERAIQRFGKARVEGIHFTSQVKEELAYPVKAAFEDKTIRIPNDRFIRSDLRSIRKTTTAAGNIRFEGEKNRDGHADRFWALALWIHATKQPTSNTFFAQLI
jgi:phage FluMu gp28-like protein